MTKLYFSKKKKAEPRLFVIIGILCLIFALLLIGPYLYSRSRAVLPAFVTPTVEGAETVFTEAKRLFDAGEIDKAEQTLKPLLKGRDPVFTPRGILLQADIEVQRGQKEEALKLLSGASDSFQGTVEYPDLVSRKARLLEELGQVEDAKAIYESVRDNAPSEQRSLGLLGLGRLAEHEGNLFAARDLYRNAVEGAPWGSAVWNEAVEEMGRLNVQLIFSPEESEESRYYAVESGDSLISIGMKLNTTQGLLVKANNIDDVSRLTLGQRIKYTPKDFRIVIERSTCSLYLFDSRGLFKRYRVGLGKAGHETALGSYVLGNKQKDPTWFKPGAGPIPAGDPANELGSRWMPMTPSKEGLPTDLGIHGTIAPDTVGQYSSMGCARMTNNDVEELFDLVVRSTPVDVVDVYKPEEVNTTAKVPEQHADTL